MEIAIILALVTAAVLGLRHGVDYDHIAAISDLTSVSKSKRESMRLALSYALGHGSVVALLGILAVSLGLSLPQGADTIMERFVGLTLLVLGMYVLITLFTKPKTAKLKTRFTILANIFMKIYSWMSSKITGRKHKHREVLKNGYAGKSAFFIGMIHGIGAETPTQLILFILAGGIGGVTFGVVSVIIFILGLMMMNTLIAIFFTYAYSNSSMRPKIYRFVTFATAFYSIIIGFVFLFGLTEILPSLG